MTQGMSEEEVKRRLYGDFFAKAGGKGQARGVSRKEAVIKPKEIQVKSLGKTPGPRINPGKIKVIGFSLVAIICLSLLLVIISRPKAKMAGAVISEAEQLKGYLSQGKRYYRDGLFEAAILTWKNVLAINPNHRAALRYIQKAEMKKKELKIREEETAQKIKEMLAEKEGRDKEKILREKEEVARKKIKLEVEPLLKEGDLYYRQGEYERAVASYEKVLPLSPGNHRAVKNISRANEKVAEGKKKALAKVKPPPVPVSKEKGPAYTIQVAAYADRAGAEQLVKKLTERGYNMVTVKGIAAKPGKILYCVYLGSFYEKGEASKSLEKVRKDGFRDSFIKTR